MAEFRWRLADDGRTQGALFEQDGDEVLERRPGEGQFEGMEFLHVRARRIVNEVPAASRMPFRYTINAYRGCSHACTYCLAGDTPVLRADGRHTPIAELRRGDEIAGTAVSGGVRRYVRTHVLAQWSTTRAAHRVTLEDGTSIVASGLHRFLTECGWKHVAPGGAGGCRSSRPHLVVGDALVGTGAFAAAPKPGDAYRHGYACGLAAAGPLRAGTTGAGWPTIPDEAWSRGFLAGVFDGGGHWEGDVLRLDVVDEPAAAHVTRCLRRLRFDAEPASGAAAAAGRGRAVLVEGGLRAHLRFLHTTDPASTTRRAVAGRVLGPEARLRVVAVEALGVDVPMYDITTGTGNFVADGIVSHNCFARPTHEYLGMDAGEDFERRIVVKVNAVERLRAELASPRWRGDAIAMGTNTDPYQRCEGKYRLTRGIVEVLTERANPFSILTKSTLILRDLDVLADAARRTDVRASLSIGTLDEDVWRTSEPGTPHPRRRVEAVARLAGAGVRTSVLVAPVLPGLSDRPEQLEAVVRACADAGATSISATLLHLRPGVREQFMPWLARTYPHLVHDYEERYVRPYAPAGEQRSLSAAVATLLDRPVVRRRAAPARAPAPPAVPPAEPAPVPADQLAFPV